MKFNEKLIELRKKEGLSQEELGYKLNVTRQTVSKWELGQTTPEMDKLVEMSKIFNVSVDELINESEIQSESNPIIEDQPIVKESNKEKNIKMIIIAAIIIVIVLIVVKLFAGFTLFNKAANNIMEQGTETQKNIFEKFFSIFDKATEDINNTEEQKNIFEKFFSIFDKTIEDINEADEKMSVGNFNGPIEVFQTTGNVSPMLDQIMKSNKTNDRKITVKYNETETQDTEEIKKLKTNIDEFGSYEISLEYDEEGYIKEAIIEKVVSQMDISKFNSPLEIFTGTNMGGQVISFLDKIITNNNKEDRKITVKHNETETQDESEIRNIKRNIGTFDNYDVTFEYDADGFINKAIIEKF